MGHSVIIILTSGILGYYPQPFNEGFLSPAEMKLAYSTAPTNRMVAY